MPPAISQLRAPPRGRRISARPLLGVYLIGSLAHGGFSRRYSDIDVAVVTEAGLTPADFDAMRADAAAISGELAAKLSIFWTDRTFSAGRFPPLDRADYLDHGVALIERERDRRRPRPGLAEVRAYLTGKPFEGWAQGAAQFAALETLEPKSHKPYLRAHLYPARFVYSFMTGRMGSNDDAVEWLKDRAPPGLDVALIARRSTAAAPPPIRTRCFPRARRCRAKSRPAPRWSARAKPSGRELFEERVVDQDRRLAAVRLAAAEDRLALRIEPVALPVLLHGAEAQHHQRPVGVVAERVEAALRQHQRLVLLQHRQRAVEIVELRLAFQHHEDVVLVDMGVQAVLAALRPIAMDAEGGIVGLGEQDPGVTLADQLRAEAEDLRLDRGLSAAFFA